MVDVPQKKKIEAMFSDNIKLKLKIKQMYDQIKEEQAENNKQMERIRIFIKNSNMNDDLKKNLMSKIEGVLSNGLADKLNLKEIEKIAKIDQSDIQDKFLSNVIGDTVKLLKNIKNEEKKKIQQQQQPDYNQDFDPQLLEDNQQIVVQTVKKKIKQKDASGNIVEDVDFWLDFALCAKSPPPGAPWLIAASFLHLGFELFFKLLAFFLSFFIRMEYPQLKH